VAVKPLKQRNRHNPERGVYGDCHRACVASILELSLDEVPHFCDGDPGPEAWTAAERSWLREKGLAPVSVAFAATLAEVFAYMLRVNPGVFYILGGTSKNGTGHSVIALEDRIVHDPSLDDSSIVGPMEDGYVWVTVYSVGLAP
jgi:hypothetical protein